MVVNELILLFFKITAHIVSFAGHQLSVFNKQSTIQVGGRWNKTKQRIEYAFEGVMVGLVFNGLRVFDLAANKDPRTTSKGDVRQLSSILDRLNEHSLLDTMQQVNDSIRARFTLLLFVIFICRLSPIEPPAKRDLFPRRLRANVQKSTFRRNLGKFPS